MHCQVNRSSWGSKQLPISEQTTKDYPQCQRSKASNTQRAPFESNDLVNQSETWNKLATFVGIHRIDQ